MLIISKNNLPILKIFFANSTVRWTSVKCCCDNDIYHRRQTFRCVVVSEKCGEKHLLKMFPDRR